jgi:hypothetical protein
LVYLLTLQSQYTRQIADLWTKAFGSAAA